jgi:hypothetical protein
MIVMLAKAGGLVLVMQHGTWAIELIPTERILPNEEQDETRLLEVLNSIAHSGRWTAPIVLERASLAVMDGHHRLAAARRLSLPRVLLDYGQVVVEARRPEFQVDGEQIVARSRARALYPPKTMRHIFSQPLDVVSISQGFTGKCRKVTASANEGNVPSPHLEVTAI